MTFSGFEDWMIEEMRFSQKTVRNTLRMLKHMAEACDPEDRDSMNSYIRQVWSSKGNATANGYIKIANRFLRFRGKKQLKYFKEYDSFVVKICSPEEKHTLIDVASRIGKREKAIFYVLFGTGMRLQEACDLRQSDILGDRVRVRGKGQKVREIYLPYEVRSAIEDYLASRDEISVPVQERDFVFLSRNGRMTYEYFRRRCEIVAMKAAVRFHPHMARHTYATELLKQGVSVYYVSRLLGHEDLSSTQIYLHPSQNDAIEEAKKVKFFLVRNPGEVELMLRPGSADTFPLEILFLFEASDRTEEDLPEMEVLA
jgi:integrase/recombinase XerC